MIRFGRAASTGYERRLGVKNGLSHAMDIRGLHRRTPNVHAKGEVLVLIPVSYLLCPGDSDTQAVEMVCSRRRPEA